MARITVSIPRIGSLCQRNTSTMPHSLRGSSCSCIRSFLSQVVSTHLSHACVHSGMWSVTPFIPLSLSIPLPVSLSPSPLSLSLSLSLSLFLLLQTNKQTNKQTHTHTHARAHAHTHTHTPTPPRTHTHMHMCSNTHVCTSLRVAGHWMCLHNHASSSFPPRGVLPSQQRAVLVGCTRC